MKYISMMNCPKTGYESLGSWPHQDIQAHIHGRLKQGSSPDRELVTAEGLAGPAKLR